MMAESQLMVEDLLALCLKRITMEEKSLSTEQEMLEVVKNFETVRKRWLQAELELKKYKELLVKSDVAKAALEVKLKHARNQLDIEMKKRYKIEGDYQYLRQMQLMCDILVHDSKSSSFLNDEQKSLLAAFEQRGTNQSQRSTNKRLSVIDESSFLSHSDISYDRTDDDVDLDTTVIKPLRSRVREKRRSSMGLAVSTLVAKRGRGGNMSTEVMERRTVEKEVETIVKASVMTPESGGHVHMVVGVTQKTPEAPSITTEGTDPGGGDQTSVWFPSEDTAVEPEAEVVLKEREKLSNRALKTIRHVFLSKTVIRTETCSPCGKRIRFGKMAVKCRNCRMVAHPECKQKLTDGCSASNTVTGRTAQMDSLEVFAPLTRPRVPQVIVDCVAEIERRGLQERGLYRVPGGERLVRELSEQVLQGTPSILLSKVQDIHVVCGLLKDFLRRLKEPLVTFRLHRTFMEASELQDEDTIWSIFYQSISELPRTNRDTLAFLMLHLHKVMRSPQCQMDQKNLARVFGPTIVGHGMSEPSPSTIMRDTPTQPKVVCRLLSLPEDYWRRVLQTDQIPLTSSSSRIQNVSGRLFQPLTSPENRCNPNLSSAVPSTGRAEPVRRFFTSPTASEHT